ncbi:MAG: aminopeptidase [Actinomycetota bacterium]|nr:aminopeptidase [Actinomycetota bacterium]
MEDLSRAVAAVITECLRVQEGENVLVVANPATLGLGERLRGEAGRAGADAVLMLMAERATHGTEPPPPVAAAMASADVVLCPTEQSLSHTTARREACAAGTRIATLPGVTEEMLARVMSADMGELRRRGAAVAEALDAGFEARITCERGSDLTLRIEGRKAISDAGELDERGAFGNLPCGEGFIGPLETEGGGVLVVDGTIGGIGRVGEPVTLRVENGNLEDASGPEGARLLEMLRGAGVQGTGVAELGIGTNEKAILTGNLLEDEKILGTCHVAFGASAGVGGVVQVPIHIDCVVLKPTVEIDGQAIVREGMFLL